MHAASTIPPILRSWQRCSARLRSEDAAPAPMRDPQHGANQSLLLLARSSIEDLYQLIEQPGFAVLFADPHAIALHLEGDPTVLALCSLCGLRPPVDLNELRAGTNAVDLALREAQPFQTSGTEHYSLHLHQLSLAAAPIFAPDGSMLGALAVVSQADNAHPHTLGLAIAAAQALQHQLHSERLLAEANDQLAELYATLETISEGLIFVGEHGEIRRINKRAAEILGVSRRAVAGRSLAGAISVPPLVQLALSQRRELHEQELLWQGQTEALPAICDVQPVWDAARRYLGSLITLRPTQSMQRLLQHVVGAQARFTFRDMIGQSPAMLQAFHQSHLAAKADGCVLLRGEAGVGKEILAQAIHNASARSGGAFVSLNCAAVPRPLLEGELFGSEERPDRANQPTRPGKLELAHGGTLYLEAVGALPFELQTALLRTIETQRTFRSNGSRPLRIDARLMVAEANLLELVQEGRFRADLAAHLSAFTVEVPPLRQRGDDLLLMVNYFLTMLGERLGRQIALAPDALQAMRAYPWPGNVRELEVTIEQVIQRSERSVISLEDLPPAIAHGITALVDTHHTRLAESQELTERETILRAGRQSNGRIGDTALLLGVSRATLWRKMQRYGITRADFWAGDPRMQQ